MANRNWNRAAFKRQELWIKHDQYVPYSRRQHHTSRSWGTSEDPSPPRVPSRSKSGKSPSLAVRLQSLDESDQRFKELSHEQQELLLMLRDSSIAGVPWDNRDQAIANHLLRRLGL
jgi:hypothetical protein